MHLIIIFANIRKNLAASVKYTDLSPVLYMPLKQSHGIFLNPISYEEIELGIIKLKPKATGPFSVPENISKLIKRIICKPLEILFNTSLLTEVVLDCFKIARVIPVHKKKLNYAL